MLFALGLFFLIFLSCFLWGKHDGAGAAVYSLLFYAMAPQKRTAQQRLMLLHEGTTIQ